MRGAGRRASSRRRASTPLIASLLAAAVAVGVVPPLVGSGPTASAQSESPAEQAAREIREARDRANAAAEAFFEANSQLALLEDELVRLEGQEVELQAEVDALRREVENVAVSRFMQSGTAGIPLLTEIGRPQDQIQAEVLVDVATNTGADVIDRFEAAEEDLRDLQDDVADQQRDVEAQQDVYLALQDEANAEVERLRAIEEERLADEAVQRALEAQIAEERARLEEEARRQAEAEARANPNPGVETIPTTSTTVPPSTLVEPPDDGGDAGESGDDVPVGPTTTTTTTTLPPASTLPPDSGRSGGTSGGRTGEGGGGNDPSGVFTAGGYVDNIICPMPGSAYADTWGAPRSGGRRHQGVDMLAPTGISIFAVIGGFATFKQNRLGGNAVSLVGDNGNRYYYAHLSRYEGVSRRVEQGDVIGYNGDTGNATGVPHLHFQVHPGGGQAVNPTPSVRAAGC
ncbi:MAG: peptidoglycan DD-metalloendopeptidase family protein [Actinomycetota bacterium]